MSKWVRSTFLALAAGLVFLLPGLCGCGPSKGKSAESEKIEKISARAEPVADSQSGLRDDHARFILRLDRSIVEPGQPITGTVTGPFASQMLHLLLVDTAQRVVASTDLVPPNAKTRQPAKFSARIPPGSIGQAFRLMLISLPRVAARQKGPPPEAQLQAEAEFRVASGPPPWNDFLALLAAEPVSSPSFWDRLQAQNVAGVFCRSDDAAAELVTLNVPFISELLPPDANPLLTPDGWDNVFDDFNENRTADLLLRQPPLFDEKALETAQAALSRSVGLKQRATVLGWSLGSTPSLTRGARPFDDDRTPQTLDVFREWLKRRYNRLSSLNRQWGTNFKKWEQVLPPLTDQAKARQNPSYAEALRLIAAPEDPSVSPRDPHALPYPVEKETVAPGGPDTKIPAPAADSKTPPATLRQTPAPATAGKTSPPEAQDGAETVEIDPEELAKELPEPGGENYSAWCDFRVFNDFAFARLLREFRSRLRQQDSAAAIGFCGAPEMAAWGGWDWSQLAPALDWVEFNGSGATREMLQALAPNLRRFGRIGGGQPDDVYGLWENWLRGDAGVLLASRPMADGHAPLSPDEQLLAGELRLLGEGLTLLRQSSPEHKDPIALYLSPRSVYLHWMLDSGLAGLDWAKMDSADWRRNSALLQYNAWLLLLEDLGYSPTFVQPRQLLSGELQKAGIRVLILPKVLSLGSEEVDALREFVRRGGTVMADGECGTFDGGGRRRELANADPQPLGALDADFGVARRDFRVLEMAGRSGATADDEIVMRHPQDAHPVGPQSSELRVLEPGLVAAGGWTFAMSKKGTPAILSRSGGLGRFVYLNMCLQGYPKLRERSVAEDFVFHGMEIEDYVRRFGEPTGGEGIRLVVSDLLTDVIAENPLRVRTPAGAPVRGIKRTRFRLGEDADLIAVLPLRSSGWKTPADDGPLLDREEDLAAAPGNQATQPQAVWVMLPQRRHWYNVRTGAYLGVDRAAQAQLDPDAATLLAALPYRVDRLNVRASEIENGVFRLEAELATSGATAQQHVFHIDVFAPSGERLPYYSRNVVAPAGDWKDTVGLALNEPRGTYRLVVRDAITGTEGAVQLEKRFEAYAKLVQPRRDVRGWIRN